MNTNLKATNGGTTQMSAKKCKCGCEGHCSQQCGCGCRAETQKTEADASTEMAACCHSAAAAERAGQRDCQC